MTTRRSPLCGLATWLLAAPAPLAAPGDVLHAVRGSELWVVDVDALEAELVGHLDHATVGGLAFAHDGTLYGVAVQTNELVAIDAATAASAAVGALGEPTSTHTGVAHDPTTGQLFAVGSGGSGTSSLLVGVSAATGAASVVGDTGAKVLVGLEADAGGALFALDGSPGQEELLRVDPLSGDATVVAPDGLDPFPQTGSLAVGQSGTLWTLHGSAAPYELVRVDAELGTGTCVGPLVGIGGAGAFAGLAARAEGFVLYPPGPGTPGPNTVFAVGAPPLQPVFLLAALAPGATPVPSCSGLVLGLAAPSVGGATVADAAGVARFDGTLRPSLVGTTLWLQAVAPRGCAASAAIAFTP